MVAYADWGFYQGKYRGELVEEAAFGRLAERASAALDMMTYGRIDGVYGRCEAVKMACCAVADVLAEAEGRGRDIVRERLDEYEVVYGGGEVCGMKARMLAAARVYLWRTGLLSMAVTYGI